MLIAASHRGYRPLPGRVGVARPRTAVGDKVAYLQVNVHTESLQQIDCGVGLGLYIVYEPSIYLDIHTSDYSMPTL